MSANLYDLLNVDESASTDEIRAAWKSAIADLDPTERRFRAFNDAAGVLLDTDKRAAYDAGLVEARDKELAAEQAAEAAAAASAAADEPDAVTPAVPVDLAKAPATSAAADAPTDDPADDPTDPTPAAPSTGPSSTLLIAAAIAAVLAIAVTIWLITLDGVRAEESPKDVAERAATQDRATLEVETAAEQLVTPVLSYNHQTMAADLERLREYLTPDMAAKQAKAWPDLTAEAVAQEIVVEASATATALSRIDPDGKRATVVVFIDQRVTKKAAEPFVLRMWATMSLVESDGAWLLDDLCTDASCG
ncbi:J domain-containing protein [Nocardioides sp. Root190]|uniref:J domain-containing protein n=1 Tax=Nocardioides sp. Root190 TaxID=1736488 RepID=UPI000A484267|nr:DnaJ domain-containing protein [Nocardioides sp. Root190]